MSTSTAECGVSPAREGATIGRTTPNRLISGAAAVAITGICALLSWHIAYKATQVANRGITILYTLVVGTYVVSRFVLAALYRPPADAGIRPTVAIVVPAFNEGAVVRQTIDACMALRYPADQVECVVVDDGSQDDTYDQMRAAAARYPPGRVQCIPLEHNQGKRAAMATGIRATTADVLVFVDSDSHPEPNAVGLLVQAFADQRVGAVSGISFVRNADYNTLTRMQAARYLVSFQLLKAAESTLGAVTCCSGCFSAYRRAAVTPLLDAWEHQRFLGADCTYGDDRALTNRVIKDGWRTVYDFRAHAWTDAPTRYGKFFRQQLRWKKSWARESVLMLGHIWRSRPIAFPSVLIATLAGLLSPIIMVANLFGRPLISGVLPMVYLTGLYLVAMSYGLFHRAWRDDRLWPFAILGTFFYLICSVQLVWALVWLRNGSWGTRTPGPGTGQASLSAPLHQEAGA
jgi:hyaluronan synthase